MEGYDRTTYGEGFADVYDDWYADVSPVEATVDFVTARATGPVLELGSGTGRLAGPLARRLPTVGLDASAAMLDRSRAGHRNVPVVRADMTAPPLRTGSCGAVLVAFNTLFNLDAAGQHEALASAERLVRHDGVVVVEAFVPGEGADSASDRVDVVRLDADLVVLRVSRTDPDGGAVSGHHVELRDGAPVRLRPWQITFHSPGELDGLASAAGLTLAERYGGWGAEPFDHASSLHVSVYRPARTRR